MYKRLSLVLSLAVLLVVALSFASAVAAQEDTPEETTLQAADTENSQNPSEETTLMAADAQKSEVEVKTDNVTVKREDGKVSAKTSNSSTSNETSSQQSSLTVQQNQADEGVGSQANTGVVNVAQNSSSSCKNPTEVGSLDQTDADGSITFNTTGEKFRVTYDVTFGTDAPSSKNFRIEIDRNGTEVVPDKTTNVNVTDKTFIVSKGSDTYKLIATLSNEGTGTTFDVIVDDCRGRDSGGGGGNRDGNRDGVRFRFNRDNDGRGVARGAARRQYDNEVIVKTIPDKGRLSDTGGVPLAGIAVVALASVGLGLSILRSATRRDP